MVGISVISLTQLNLTFYSFLFAHSSSSKSKSENVDKRGLNVDASSVSSISGKSRSGQKIINRMLIEKTI